MGEVDTLGEQMTEQIVPRHLRTLVPGHRPARVLWDCSTNSPSAAAKGSARCPPGRYGSRTYRLRRSIIGLGSELKDLTHVTATEMSSAASGG